MKPPIIMVPMPTPCSPTGEPDLEGLARLSQDMIDKKCDALFVLSSTGRGPWFAAAERDRIIGCGVEAARGRTPVFVGCQSIGLPQMLACSRRAADLGATGVVVTAPTYFAYSADEMRRILHALADRSPLPVILYDVPMYTQTRMNEEVILELAAHENVVGMKDTTDDLDRFLRMADRLRSVPGFVLLQGKETHLTESLDEGCGGFVSTFCAIAPHEFVSVRDAWIAGDVDQARLHQKTITMMYRIVVDWLERRPETSTLFFFVQRVLETSYPGMNILLDHERDFPEDLYRDAERLRQLCRNAPIA